jgi:hypothetical protein
MVERARCVGNARNARRVRTPVRTSRTNECRRQQALEPRRGWDQHSTEWPDRVAGPHLRRHEPKAAELSAEKPPTATPRPSVVRLELVADGQAAIDEGGLGHAKRCQRNAGEQGPAAATCDPLRNPKWGQEAADPHDLPGPFQARHRPEVTATTGRTLGLDQPERETRRSGRRPPLPLEPFCSAQTSRTVTPNSPPRARTKPRTEVT